MMPGGYLQRIAYRAVQDTGRLLRPRPMVYSPVMLAAEELPSAAWLSEAATPDAVEQRPVRRVARKPDGPPPSNVGRDHQPASEPVAPTSAAVPLAASAPHDPSPPTAAVAPSGHAAPPPAALDTMSAMHGPVEPRTQAASHE